jgi:TRAP-type C4-dicarboxylate transport system permease large subunit
MRLDGFTEAMLGTAKTTALIFLILLGAAIFNAFLGFTKLPNFAADFFRDSGLSPYSVLMGMIILYILLGFIMDSLSMILLTVPIFWPIIAGLDFGALQGDDLKLWFGIISLIVVEVGLITPPVGLNVFVINSMAPNVPMLETFRGVVPFLASDAIRVTLIVLVPSVTLILPHLLQVK